MVDLVSVQSLDVFGQSQFICVFGASRSGKSYLTRHLVGRLFAGGYVNKALILSPTGDEDWAMIPAQWKCPRFDAERVRGLIASQHQLQYPDALGDRAVLVFDDMLGMVDWGSDLMTNLVTTYRHHGIYIIVTAQQMVKIPTLFRENCSMAFIFRQPRRTVKLLYDAQFGDDYESADEFGEVLRTNTWKDSDHDGADIPPHTVLLYSRYGIGPQRQRYWRYAAPPNSDDFELILD